MGRTENRCNGVSKAVFPVGGLGTRFLPATKAIPKEMLPVVDKPLIQYAVEEAYAAGIRQMIFVTGRHKRAIGDHFDAAFELEYELERGHKTELLAVVHAIKPEDMDCVFIRQPRPQGLGHAVLCAESVVGKEPFAVLLADDLMLGREQRSGGPTILQQMVRAYEAHPGTILAVQDVPRQDTRRYGVVDVHGVNETVAEVFGMVEKPVPEVAPSTLAVAGRYILTPAAWRGRGNPAHRRHCRPDRHREGVCLPLRRRALRLRQQRRLSGSHDRPGAGQSGAECGGARAHGQSAGLNLCFSARSGTPQAGPAAPRPTLVSGPSIR